MRMAILAVVLALICYVNAGCNGDKDKDVTDKDVTTDTDTDTTKTTGTTCSGTTCNVVVYINEKCEPSYADLTPIMKINSEPGQTICFFNSAPDTVTLQLPSTLVASSGGPYNEYTLAPSQCVSVQVLESAANSNHSIQMTGCTTPGGGVGNPEVVVGGGGGG